MRATQARKSQGRGDRYVEFHGRRLGGIRMYFRRRACGALRPQPIADATSRGRFQRACEARVRLGRHDYRAGARPADILGAFRLRCTRVRAAATRCAPLPSRSYSGALWTRCRQGAAVTTRPGRRGRRPDLENQGGAAAMRSPLAAQMEAEVFSKTLQASHRRATYCGSARAARCSCSPVWARPDVFWPNNRAVRYRGRSSSFSCHGRPCFSSDSVCWRVST